MHRCRVKKLATRVSHVSNMQAYWASLQRTFVTYAKSALPNRKRWSFSYYLPWANVHQNRFCSGRGTEQCDPLWWTTALVQKRCPIFWPWSRQPRWLLWSHEHQDCMTTRHPDVRGKCQSSPLYRHGVIWRVHLARNAKLNSKLKTYKRENNVMENPE